MKQHIKEGRKIRESNIEVLRILSTMGVVVLHYNLNAGIFADKAMNTFSYWVLYCLESMSVCAVDLFLIISGYYMCNSNKRNLWKPIELVAQIILFSMARYIIQIIIGIKALSLTLIIPRLIPSNNYFVILYCAVYLLSPYINIAMDHLEKQSLKRMMVLIIGVLSVYPTLIDFFEAVTMYPNLELNSVGRWGDQSGYTVVNFMVCWSIGAYLKKREPKVEKARSLGAYIFFAIAAGGYAKIMLAKGAGIVLAFSYCSPFVIAAAVSVFLLFKEIKCGYIRSINSLAKASFSVYLLHGILLP